MPFPFSNVTHLANDICPLPSLSLDRGHVATPTWPQPYIKGSTHQTTTFILIKFPINSKPEHFNGTPIEILPLFLILLIIRCIFRQRGELLMTSRYNGKRLKSPEESPYRMEVQFGPDVDCHVILAEFPMSPIFMPTDSLRTPSDDEMRPLNLMHMLREIRNKEKLINRTLDSFQANVKDAFIESQSIEAVRLSTELCFRKAGLILDSNDLNSMAVEGIHQFLGEMERRDREQRPPTNDVKMDENQEDMSDFDDGMGGRIQMQGLDERENERLAGQYPSSQPAINVRCSSPQKPRKTSIVAS
ncbi:unnamed protein product [Caenorhabditis nigoni]